MILELNIKILKPSPLMCSHAIPIGLQSSIYTHKKFLSSNILTYLCSITKMPLKVFHGYFYF